MVGDGNVGWDVAQLVENQPGTSLTQVRFSGAARDFSQESIFSANSPTVSVHSRVKSYAFTSVPTLKIPYSMSAFGGLWKHYNTQHAP